MSAGKLPEGWIESELSALGHIVTGKTPSTKQRSNFGGDIPFIKPGDLDLGGYIITTVDTLTDEGLTLVPELPANSIVVTCIGNLGKVGITFRRSASNQQINALIPSGKINVKFVYYQILTLKPWLESQSAATTIAIVNKSKFSQAPFKFPPISEQKIIAEKLDTLLAQVDSTKARLEQIPKILKRFRQAVLSVAVEGKLTNSDTKNWVLTKVEDLVKIINGKSFPSTDYQKNGVKLLRPGNLHKSGQVIWTEKNTTYLPNDWAIKRPELSLKNGVLLMNLTAQSLKDEFLGRVCILNNSDEVILLNQRISAFISDVNYDVLPFLFIYFRSPQFRTYIDTLDSGTLIKHLNIKDIKSYSLKLPSAEEQHEIVRRVEQLFAYADTIEKQVNNALARVDNLTQSILAKAFRGELTAQWRAENPELISGENSAAALLEKIKAERAASSGKKTRVKNLD
ncbi:restriction endonuclease subunit S [Pantoea sp. UYEF8]|uniref:restriction endonuclease subunit S n=1 Tax=Pantoea sp. UYEF8 TaxID=1756394 RepID=UPI003390EC3F